MSKTCDNCTNPGVCCQAFFLSDDDKGAFTLDDDRSKVQQRLAENNLPFSIIGKSSGKWVRGCNQLGKDGRCKIYSTRPDLCRSYRPGTGGLCCMSKKFSPLLNEFRVAKIIENRY